MVNKIACSGKIKKSVGTAVCNHLSFLSILDFENLSILQDAILKLGPLPRLLNDISVALRNPQLHMPTNHQPDRPKDRLFSRPSFNRLMSSDFQSLMMRDLNRYLLVFVFFLASDSVHENIFAYTQREQSHSRICPRCDSRDNIYYAHSTHIKTVSQGCN